MPDGSTAQRSERLISLTATALHLGVDTDTLVRWHLRDRGPTAHVVDGTQLAYRRSDLESWRDRLCSDNAGSELIVRNRRGTLSVC